MANVNKIDGSLSQTLPLVSLPGQNGLGIGLALSYSSNIVRDVTTWNREAPTDICGLGWKLPLNQILREPMHTGDQDDDVFMLVVNGSAAQLKLVSDDRSATDRNRTYRTAPASYMTITRQTKMSGAVYTRDAWTVTDGSGLTQSFGGDINRLADQENYQSEGNSIEWEVVWGAWSGPTTTIRNGGTRVQQQQPIAWNLRKTANPTAQSVVYDYALEELQVGDDGGLRYTRCAYLTGVMMNPGYRVVLTYVAKKEFEFPPTRVWKPSTTNPNYSVTQHQGRFTTKALDSVEIYNQTSFSTDLIGKTRLNYAATFGDTANPKLLNAAIPEMAKRLLLSVHEFDRFGVEASPPIRFSYWGIDGHGSFNVGKNTGQTFDGGRGGLFGALRSTTSPAGEVETYVYERAPDTMVAQTFAIDDPNKYGSTNSFYTFFYGNDFVVMVTRTGSSGSAVLNFRLFDFNGSWSQKWSASVPVKDFRTGDTWWTANWNVSVGPNFFVIAVDQDSIKSGILPLIVHRDPSNADRWLAWGTLPRTTTSTYASYHNFYRPVSDWEVVVSDKHAAIYEPASGTIFTYSFDGTMWHAGQIAGVQPLAGWPSDIALQQNTLFQFAVISARIGRLKIVTLDPDGSVKSSTTVDAPLGAVDYEQLGHLKIDARGNRVAAFYIQALDFSHTPRRVGAIALDFAPGRQTFSRIQLIDREYFDYDMNTHDLRFHAPSTVLLSTNNTVTIHNAHVLQASQAHFYSKTWRYNGSTYVYNEIEQKLDKNQIFASGGFEDAKLKLNSSYSGAMEVLTFSPRTLTWSTTGIVGSAMSDWDLAWKIVFDVLNVVAIPISVVPFGQIATIMLAALDVAVLAFEIAFSPDETDVDLGFGEAPLYLFSAKSVESSSAHYVDTNLYLHNPDTDGWDLVGNAKPTGEVHGTSALAMTDRGLMMEVQLIGNQGERKDYYFHAANGVIYNQELLGPDRVYDNSRHVDAGHDIMASIRYVSNVNTIRLYRYFNRSWLGPASLYRVKSVSTNDSYQTTTLGYAYHAGTTYPVRFDASMGTVFYNKVAEEVVGANAGTVETYSYNGILLPPPNAPAGGNALAHSTAVIGATYCTIATGAGGVVSTDEVLHQVYAIEKGGETDYLTLEVGSINETDGVVTSQQQTYDLDISGNPRASRSFAGLPDLSSEHQSSRTTYAHEIPAYAALKAKGFLDGPVRSESEIRNSIASTVTIQFTTQWGRDFGANGALDQNAPFVVAKGVFGDGRTNRAFNLYKTTAGAVKHVCSDFSDLGSIINAGVQPSELDGTQAATPTLIGPSGGFEPAMVGWIGRKKSGVATLELVQNNATRVVEIAPTSPKLGLGDATAAGRTIFASEGSRVHRIAATAAGFSTTFLDLGEATTTSPFAMPSDWFAVGLAGTPGGSDWTIVCHQKTASTTQSGFNARLGSCDALTEITGVSYGTAARQFYLVAGVIRGDLLDVVVLDGASTNPNGSVLAKLTGLQAARPATVDSLFAWRNADTGAVVIHVLQGDSVATLRFAPAAGAVPASLVLVDRTEFVGTPIGSPVLDDSGRLFLAVQGADRGVVISIGTDGRLAGTFRIENAAHANAGVTAPLARAGSAIAALGVTDLTNPTMATLTGVTAIVPQTPRQISATTWNTQLVAPVASYAWRGTGNNAFAGWTDAAGTDYADWVRSDAVVSSDPATATPIEVLSTDGDLGSVLLGAESLVTVATFSSGSVRQGTAFFTAFERYERLVTNAQASFTSQCLTGSRGLTIMAEANAVTLAIADQPLRQAAGKLVLCLWAEAAGSFRVNLIGAPDLAMTATFAASPANAWAKYETIFEVGDAWRGKTLSLAIATTGTQALLVDHIWLAPLGASMQAVVRKPVTLAPLATIDQRGGVARIVNDHFDTPIAAVAPDGKPVRLTVSQLALQRSGATALNPAKPNTTLDMPLFGGGKATVFDVDFSGWAVSPGPTNIENGEVILAQGQTLTNGTNTNQQSWAVRLQLNAYPTVTAKPEGQVKFELGGSNGVVATWLSEPGGMAGSLELRNKGVLVGDTRHPCPWGRDWLIASIGDSGLIADGKATLYVVVDGEIAASYTSPDKVTLSSIAISKTGAGSISVRNPVIGYVPGASITYVDGSGDARQVQSHESAAALVIQETVYDQTKTARFQTVPTRKGAGATKSQCFAFEAGFVEKRDPASGGDLWSTDPAYQNRGSMAGLVQAWRLAEGLDMDSSFYSYNALYPTSDPLQREKEATDSAKEFAIGRAGSVRSGYGRDAEINAMLDAGGVPQRIRVRFAAQTGSSALQHPKLTAQGTSEIAERRALSRTAQDVLGHLTISEASALTITKTPQGTTITEDTAKLRSSSAMSWKIDAGQTITARMPKSFELNDPAAFIVTTELDRFGRPVTSTGPDRGRSDMVHDDLDRVRFAQDAVGAQAPTGSSQFFLYRDYDREGRVTESGLIVRSWDAGLLKAAAPYPAWRTQQGARAIWSGDQASGNLADLSGNGLTGMISGTSFVDDGPNGLGKAIAFNGTSNYVEIGTPAPLQGLTEITISAWVKRGAMASDRGIVVGGTSGGYVSLAHRSSGPQIDLTVGAASLKATLPADTGWVHVVATAGPSGSRIYLNGSEAASSTAARTFPTGTLYWVLGCSAMSATTRGFFYNGRLRDVRVFPRVLEPGRAAALYLEGLSRPASKLVYDAYPETPVTEFNGLPAQLLTYNRAVTDAGRPDMADAARTAEGLVAERYRYDVNGRVTSQIVKVPDFDATERTIGYGYDALGNVSKIDYPA